ncbi:MAG: uroporphyrinogen-III synthase [Methylococcaceae bacterium]|nr:uroporphyrinogen-III synthase [Methylococcaceae bacterium]
MSKRILVTRPYNQSTNLCRLIEQQSWQAIKFPVIDIQSKTLSDKECLSLRHIDEYKYVFFVSINAVNFAYEILNHDFECLKRVTCIAVGLATYHQLAKYAIDNTLLPSAGFNSEGILDIPELQDLGGQSCLIIRGEGGREFLASTLRERGASVDYIEVYARIPVSYQRETINSILFAEPLDAVVIYSIEALYNLVQIADEVNKKNNLLIIPLVVISQRVCVIARSMGFTKILIAKEATDMAMINALNNGENCGESN